VNRVTITSAIAWLLAIGLLWFMIMIDSDESRWLKTGSSERGEDAVTKPVLQPANQPVDPTCEETELSLQNRVDTSRYCMTDNDCTLFDFGYPIDCMTSVARTEITELRYAFRRYEESCDHRVYFDCPTEPMERRAVCRDNRCTVSLESIDVLEEETLDYLGLGNAEQIR
jgi:hypothetical protein